MSIYEGSCHCQGVKFSVDTDLSSPIRCNCSFCRRRGSITEIIDADRFRLIGGDDMLNEYGGRPFAKHNFCKGCGIHVFTRIQAKEGRKVGFNIGCLPSVDIEELDVKCFDGKNLL